ncbi:MAG: hypothetical protein AAGJ32_04410 [Pseudomonadota bacterium]
MVRNTRQRDLLAAGTLCLAAAGCTSLGSQMDRSLEGRSNTGVQYYLPKTLVTLELYKSPDGFVFPRLSEQIVGDTDFSYVAKLNRAIAADNQLTVTVDPRSRLLDSDSSALSTARGAEIAKNFARSITALESGGQRRRDIFVGKVVFDPLDQDAVRRANVALSSAFQAFVRQDCAFEVDDETGELLIPGGIFADEILIEQCFFLQDLADDPRTIQITVSNDPGKVPLPGDAPEMNVPLLDADDFRNVCSSGLCYRATAPHRITVAVADRYIVDDILDLPNNQPPLVIRQPAGVFADQTTQITWVNGMPSTVGVDRNSELAGVASVPAQVVEALSEATIAGFRRDSDEIAAEVNLLNAQANLLNARAGLVETEADTQARVLETDAELAARLAESDNRFEERLDAVDASRFNREGRQRDRSAARADRALEGLAVPDDLSVTPGGFETTDPPATDIIPR